MYKKGDNVNEIYWLLIMFTWESNSALARDTPYGAILSYGFETEEGA